MGTDETDRPDLKEKRNAIREAFRHAWHGYESIAFGTISLLLSVDIYWLNQITNF